MLKLKKQKLIKLINNIRWVCYKLFIVTPFSYIVVNKNKPDYLLDVPSSTWPGDFKVGQEIIENNFIFEKEKISIENIWSAKNINLFLLRYLHKFEWLYHLREVGNSPARKISRQIIKEWLVCCSKYNNFIWHPEILSSRLAVWIGLLDFFCSSAQDNFRQQLFSSIARQSDYLYNVVLMKINNDILIFKGLIFASMALPGFLERKFSFIIREFEAALKKQVCNDGMNIAESPYKQLIILRDLIEIRSILSYFHKPIPFILQSTIEKMTLVLNLLKHLDGNLAQFNDTKSAPKALVDKVLDFSNVSKRVLSKSIGTRFVRVQKKRTLILMNLCNENGFELSVGTERLIVGTQILGVDLSKLKLLIGNVKLLKNISEKSFDNQHLIESTYKFIGDKSSFIHTRRLCLMDNGNDIRGEDTFCGITNIPFLITFPFYFKIKKIALAKDNRTLIFRSPKGVSFKFQASQGVNLKICDIKSIGDSYEMNFSRCIVLNGNFIDSKTTVKWAFKRLL